MLVIQKKQHKNLSLAPFAGMDENKRMQHMTNFRVARPVLPCPRAPAQQLEFDSRLHGSEPAAIQERLAVAPWLVAAPAPALLSPAWHPPSQSSLQAITNLRVSDSDFFSWRVASLLAALFFVSLEATRASRRPVAFRTAVELRCLDWRRRPLRLRSNSQPTSLDRRWIELSALRAHDPPLRNRDGPLCGTCGSRFKTDGAWAKKHHPVHFEKSVVCVVYCPLVETRCCDGAFLKCLQETCATDVTSGQNSDDDSLGKMLRRKQIK